jgi:hypothetical protein
VERDWEIGKLQASMTDGSSALTSCLPCLVPMSDLWAGKWERCRMRELA